MVNDHQEVEQDHTLLLEVDSAPRCVHLRMCTADHQFDLNKPVRVCNICFDVLTLGGVS